MIKKLLLAIAMVSMFTTTFAQGKCPKVYIGLSTGLENQSGLIGFNLDVPIIPSVSLGTGIGLSSWGAKTYLEGRYYFKPCHRGWAIGAGFTYNAGLSDFTTPLPDAYGNSYDVTMDLEPTANAFIAGYHFFNLGKRSRFYLQSGYAFRLTQDNYTVRAGGPLSSDAKTVMRILQPGGFMLALGFSFGLGK